jgi:hypothetical protein
LDVTLRMDISVALSLLDASNAASNDKVDYCQKSPTNVIIISTSHSITMFMTYYHR